jgi:hypothetical protein
VQQEEALFLRSPDAVSAALKHPLLHRTHGEEPCGAAQHRAGLQAERALE